MFTLARTKDHSMLIPQTVTDTSTSSVALDVSDYSEIKVLVLFGAIGAADVTKVSIQECDTIGGSYADISGTAVTSVTQTDDNRLLSFNINMRNNRLKFIKVLVDPGNAATTFTAVAIGLPKSGGPTSAADAGSFNDNSSTRTVGLESWVNV